MINKYYSQLFKWHGKLSRKEFLISFILSIVLTIIVLNIELAFNKLIGSDNIAFFLIFEIYVIFAIMRKRLRDFNSSGLWLLAIPLFLFQAIAIHSSSDGLIMIIKLLLATPFWILLFMCFFRKSKNTDEN